VQISEKRSSKGGRSSKRMDGSDAISLRSRFIGGEREKKKTGHLNIYKCEEESEGDGRDCFGGIPAYLRGTRTWQTENNSRSLDHRVKDGVKKGTFCCLGTGAFKGKKNGAEWNGQGRTGKLELQIVQQAGRTRGLCADVTSGILSGGEAPLFEVGELSCVEPLKREMKRSGRFRKQCGEEQLRSRTFRGSRRKGAAMKGTEGKRRKKMCTRVAVLVDLEGKREGDCTIVPLEKGGGWGVLAARGKKGKELVGLFLWVALDVKKEKKG